MYIAIPRTGQSIAGTPVISEADLETVFVQTRTDIRNATGVFSVLDFGAVGDGITSDSAAFTAAIAAAFAKGGGCVWVPSSKTAYVLSQGITLLSGVSLVGDGAENWFGANQTYDQWCKIGSWINPTDLSQPAITVAGVGCKVRGLNFIHNQPVPSSTAGTPYSVTIFPYCIRVTQNFVGVEDIMIVNASHGIAWDYLSTNGGGTYCYMCNIFSGALKQGVYFHNVNDTMHIANYRERGLWYGSNSNVVDYFEANKVGWRIEYLDNPQITGVEFFQCWKAISAGNSNVNAGGFNLTHALVLGQVVNLSFNLCVQGIDLDLPTTVFSASLTNVIVQSDTSTNRAAGYFFNLASDGADVIMQGVTCPTVGYSFMSLGGGSTGKATITALRIDYYSQLGAGSPAFLLGAGAYLDVPTGMQGVTRAFGAGPKISGAGAVRSFMYDSNFYADREGGTVGLIPAAPGDDTSGYVGFFNTGSTMRRGYVGASSPTAQEITLAADSGSVNINCVGCRLQVRSDGIIAGTDANGVRKFSINMGTGNAIFSGTVTQNGTP